MTFETSDQSDTRHDLTNKNAVKANSESSTKIQYKDNGITSFMNHFNISDSFGPYILYNIIYSDLTIRVTLDTGEHL